MIKLPTKKYSSGLTLNSALLSAVSLFADISTEMLYPVLPVFLTQTLGAGGSIVGLVEGIALATQNIVQGFSGWLADRLHRSKPIAVAGYIMAALAKPLIGVSAIWPQALGARFFDRLGTGIRSAPRDALIASSVTEENRGKAFGLEGIGDNLGAFLGPLLAVALLFYFHVGLRSIFYFAFIPGLIAVILIILIKERPVVSATPLLTKTPAKYFPASYKKYLIATALFGLGNFSNAFLILQTRSIGVSLEMTIFIYAFFNLIAALVSYPAGALSDKIGQKSLLIVSFLIAIVVYLGFASSANIILIGLMFVLYGASQGIYRSVGKALASDLVPTASRASGLGWYSTTIGLSGLVASLVAGQLWDKIGHPAVFIYGASFAVIGTVALIFLVSYHRQEVM